MAKTYPITEAQKNYLASFHCERLTSDPANQELIKSFANRNGKGLVNNLKKHAWEDDQIGSNAYYIIKNGDGEIVLFFSLKCGVLFNPYQVINHYELYSSKNYGRIWDAIMTPQEAALPALQSIRDQNPADVLVNFSTPEAWESMQLIRNTLGAARTTRLMMRMRDEVSMLNFTMNEKASEPNQNIIRVPDTYSAIELVEFCANDCTSGCWDRVLMGHRRLGVTLFWAFIVPKILEINQLVGSEYVFLFAADHDINPYQKSIGKLIRTYQDMHFDFSSKLGTAKPYYDFCCQFMCQRLRTSKTEIGMDSHLKVFFDTFNEDPNADDYV